MESSPISTTFESLPPELHHQIFSYIYPPWHFEYTQVHDNFPDHGLHDVKHVASNLAADLTSTAKFSKLPSIAPLLVCRSFHDAAYPVFNASFTRHIHVISRMYWREVHWSYASIMGRATTLTMDLNHFLSLHQCRILGRMPKLEKAVFIVTDYFMRHSFYTTGNMHEPVAEGDGSQESGSDEGATSLIDLPLEGSELLSFLPGDIDLSDKHLQRRWNEMIDGPSPAPIRGYQSYRIALDHIFNGTLLARRARIYRVIVALPTLSKVSETPKFVFLVSVVDVLTAAMELCGERFAD